MEEATTRSSRAAAVIAAALALASPPALAQAAGGPPAVATTEPAAPPTAPVVPTREREGTAADGALAEGDTTADQLEAGRDGFPLAVAIGALALVLVIAGLLGLRSLRSKGLRARLIPAEFYHPEPVVTGDDATEPPDPAEEERRAQLERMVAAPPDKENPFASRKARMRRARILLRRREQQGRSFDRRIYRPETTPSTPATPDVVEA